MKNVLVTITGPSLTGKTKLADLLAPYGYEELVSTTTRPPRKGEVDGVNYNFVSVDKFKNLIENNSMIEYVQVGSNYYGISLKAFKDVLGKGKNGVAVIEPEGAKRIRAFCEENNIPLHQIFVNNPIDLLYKRLFERYKNDTLANDDEYARRARDMSVVEQEKWVKPALSGEQPYDQIFNEFGNHNEQEIVKSVVESIKKQFLNEKKTKPGVR